MNTVSTCCDGYVSSASCSGKTGRRRKLLQGLPFDVRQELTSDYLEVDRVSISQKYFEEKARKENIEPIISDIFTNAIVNNDKMLAWNIMVVLSQLPYRLLSTMSMHLAVLATRNEHKDIRELGIRCFENWGDEDACLFLRNMHFEEHWLQEYVDEVYRYIISKAERIR